MFFTHIFVFFRCSVLMLLSGATNFLINALGSILFSARLEDPWLFTLDLCFSCPVPNVVERSGWPCCFWSHTVICKTRGSIKLQQRHGELQGAARIWCSARLAGTKVGLSLGCLWCCCIQCRHLVSVRSIECELHCQH